MNIFKNKKKNPPKRVEAFSNPKHQLNFLQEIQKSIKLKKNTIKRFY
jgi:hypothetical protein